MTGTMALLGWLCTLGLIVLLVLIAGNLAMVMAHKLLSLYGDRVRADERQRVGASLGADAWWFSESPETCSALRLYAQTLVTGVSPGVSGLREEWRKMNTDTSTVVTSGG